MQLDGLTKLIKMKGRYFDRQKADGSNIGSFTRQLQFL